MTNGEKFKSVFGFGVDGSRVIAVNSTWWDCEFQIRKPKTNADRIRAMGDEELAEYIHRILENINDNPETCPSITFLKQWLSQKAN